MGMRIKALAVLLLAVLAVLLAGCSGAEAPAGLPEKPSTGNVLDEPGLLSAQEHDQLNDLIEAGNRRTDRVRVAVAVVESASGDWEQWTHQLATSWAVGEQGRNNGVLLAVDMDQRRTRLEVADGARGVIPDETAQHLLDDVLGPGLKEKSYRQALFSTVDQIYRAGEGAAPVAWSTAPVPWYVELPVVFGLLGVLGGSVVGLCTAAGRWLLNPARRTPDGGRAALEEIQRFEAENPGVRVSHTTRQAYLRYRTYYQEPSRDPLRPPSHQPWVRTVWAGSFPVWLPLYQQAPALYDGRGRPVEGLTPTYAYVHSSSSSGSGSGSSFGGGGGFSGGGPSGSF